MQDIRKHGVIRPGRPPGGHEGIGKRQAEAGRIILGRSLAGDLATSLPVRDAGSASRIRDDWWSSWVKDIALYFVAAMLIILGIGAACVFFRGR